MSRSYISVELRRRVAAQARFCCGYSLCQESVTGVAMEFDHIRPEAEGGQTVEENLWLACSSCNDRKNDRVVGIDPETREVALLFNPRTQVWTEHFRWAKEGDTILGLTPTGRATLALLQLNRPFLVQARRRWVSVGWHPPEDSLVPEE